MFPVRNVGIIYSQQYQDIMSTHPRYLNRFEIVINLIKAFEFFNCLTILPVHITSDRYLTFLKQLRSFHSQDYLMAIYKLSHICESEDQNDNDCVDFDEFGLVYDCAGFPGLIEFALGSVAGTMVAAKSIVDEKTKICINWSGGWHHAKKYEASGFCYLNDIVYGIMVLMNRFHRILYIDIDLHHGDGVEEAFFYTPRVFTLSFHYTAIGFFPVTEESGFCTGLGKGQHSAAQFSFRQEGISDEVYCRVFDRVMRDIVPIYRPDAIVIQCGADGLCTDPHKIFNLTHQAYEHVIEVLLALDLPMLVVGGGGYNYSDTAKVWTRVTALLLGHPVAEDIPEHDEFHLYGPYFDSTVLPSNRTITTDQGAIDTELTKISDQMQAFKVFNSHPSSS